MGSTILTTHVKEEGYVFLTTKININQSKNVIKFVASCLTSYKSLEGTLRIQFVK